MRSFLAAFVLLLSASPATVAVAQSASPVGNWATADKSGIIEIYHCTDSDALCGRLAWFQIKADDPNPQGLDLKDPDPARRNQPLCGLTFMYGFKAAQPNIWEDGTVYDPDSGKTYHAKMKLLDDGALDLHGYIGISLIGRSEIWTRYKNPVPQCPGR
jgi:uncharacterized protein (DUF2147 family)